MKSSLLVCACLIGATLLFGNGGCKAQDGAPGAAPKLLTPNAPELARPLFGKKLVMAHHMTGVAPLLNPQMDLRAYYPDGSTAQVGGLNMTAPMLLFNTPKNIADMPVASLSFNNPAYLAYLDQFAEHEVRSAKLLGVDGFEFFFPAALSPNDAKRYQLMIEKYFAAADRLNLEFYFTLDIAHFAPVAGLPNGADSENKRLDSYAQNILQVMNSPAIKDSKHWLRAPDGRFVFYTWKAVPISPTVKSIPQLLASKRGVRAEVEDVARAFDALEAKIGKPCAFVFRIEDLRENTPQSREFVESLLDYFPALTGWFPTYLKEDTQDWDFIRARCKARGRTFIQNAYPEMYMSKLDSKSKNKRIFSPLQLKGLPISDFTRNHVAGGLSKNFRQQLQIGVDEDLGAIDLVTWNDFLEGHHLAPELNHDFGFAILLNYYKKLWRGQSAEQAIDKDVAIVFYKKHALNALASRFNIPTTKMSWSSMSQQEWEQLEKDDDHIEIVTLLTQEATLFFRGKKVGTVPRGLHSTVLPLTPGQVSLQVQRNNKTFIDLVAPEWITDKPYRNDRLTVSYSSESATFYQEIYGKDAPKVYLDEYAEANGVPNWKQRYHFAKQN